MSAKSQAHRNKKKIIMNKANAHNNYIMIYRTSRHCSFGFHAGVHGTNFVTSFLSFIPKKKPKEFIK